MLDTNPLLREIADNLGFEDASPETLQDIAEGFALIANGVEPLPEDLSSMTDEARNFITSVMESENPMEVYGDKLANLGTIAENTSTSLNETGRSISDGITKGMEDADVETASQGLFGRIITKVKSLFGIHSPSTVMAEIGTFIIQDMLNDINSLVENVTAVWQSMKETAAGIWEKVKTTLSGTWENIKTTATTVWNTITTTLKGIWEKIKTTVATVFDGIKTKLQEVWNGINSTVERVWNNISTKITGVIDIVKQKIEGFVEKINSAIRAVKDFLSSGYEKIKGAFSGGDSGSAYSAGSYSMRSIASPYAANPAFAALSATSIPKLATGAVIPANREFLAVLGDQKHGTNIEAPLDTIMQANEQLLTKAMMQFGMMGNAGSSNPQTIIIKQYLDRKQVAEAVVTEGKIQQMSTGNNMFLLGST